MMRSLFSGVAGLKTHQTKIDVIGNNIANVNTTSYKSQSITFSELMYQTTQRASGPNATTGRAGVNARQIGLGVKSGAISTAISTSGATQTTGNPFDIRITGDAFFVVSDGKDNFFTRDGSFYVDSVGNLAMASNGYNVMGWQVDETTGTIKKDTVSALRIMSADKMTFPPEATTKAYVSGIIDKYDAQVASESGKIMNLSFYDALGYSYTAKLSMKDTDEKGLYSVELAAILDEDGKPIDISGVKFGSASIAKKAQTLQLSEAFSYNPTSKTLTYTEDDGSKTDIDISGALTPEQRTKVANAFGYSSYDSFSKLTLADGTTMGSIVEKNQLPDQLKASYEKELKLNVGATVAGKSITFDGVTIDLTSTSLDGTAKEKLANAYGYTSYDSFSQLKFADGKTIGELVNDGKLGDYFADTSGLLNIGKQIFTMDTAGRQISGGLIQYNIATGVIQSVNGLTNDFNLTLDFGDNNQMGGPFNPITIDFSASTNFNNNGTSTIGADPGDMDGLGTGRKLGQMSGISIQNDGMIYAAYDNGQTRLLGQIAVAEFTNPSGLEKKGDNLYSATMNSGDFDGIGVDIAANGGYMETGVLEMSNVDLSAEFTDMITAQRGFQANSRIISVSDSLLEELVNLKR